MASTTFSNPGIGNLFSGLAGIFAGPDPQKLMQADYLRTQRDNLMSDTAINSQKLTTMQREEGAVRDLAGVLGDPTMADTAEGRAKLMSILAQTPDGLAKGPGFAMGSSSFINPDFMPEDSDFSRALIGTGVVPDFANTPSGYTQGLDNALKVQALKNDSDLAVARVNGTTGGGSLATVSPSMSSKFAEMMTAALAGEFGGPANGMDEQYLNDLTTRATQIYQTTKNADMAIAQAMEEANLRVDDPWGFWNEKVVGDPIQLATQAAATTGLGDVLVDQSNAATPPNLTPTPEVKPPTPPVLPNDPARMYPPSGGGIFDYFTNPARDPNLSGGEPGGLPGPSGAPAPDPSQRGRGPVPNEVRGPDVIYDGGQAFAMVKGKKVPLREGEEFGSKASGQTIYFVGGRWVSRPPGGN